MISMTWPQYLRRECRVDARLSHQENELLSTLLARHPYPVASGELIGILWPDPDHEPERPDKQITHLIWDIQRKIGFGRIEHDGIGYRLCQQTNH